MKSIKARVVTSIGLDSGPCAAIVKTAMLYKSQITVIKDEIKADAKSVMSLMILAAPTGSLLTVEAIGEDEKEAAELIAIIIEAPDEILYDNFDFDAVHAYARAKYKGKSKRYVSKLILVGEGGVGKSSVINRLINNKFNPNEQSTHGLEIHTLEVPHHEDKNCSMRINCWDFGGQEIYHATHQFFLTNRSLFLLVWNARIEYRQSRIDYWLRNITARAPDSPIIVVATHIEERFTDIPEISLKEQYPQIKHFVKVSCETGEGIDNLKQHLKSVASNLPLMGEEWPSQWLSVAKMINEMDECFINTNKLFNITKKYYIDKSEAQVLFKWLHELGEILFYEESFKTHLKDIIILKPAWVSQQIARILDNKEVALSHGILTKEIIDKVWYDLQYDVRDYFIRLMEEFDLSYRVHDESGKVVSLVVERIPFERPENWDKEWLKISEESDCKEVALRYHLKIIPPGIPTWFIARSHRFSIGKHWRTGAVLIDSAEETVYKHVALLNCSVEENVLTIKVRGPLPHRFFTLMQDGIELTLKRYRGLKIQKKIPCRTENCNYEFDFSFLEKRLQISPPRLTIECPNCLEIHSVINLLDGISENVDLITADGINRIDNKLDQIRGQSSFLNQYIYEQSAIIQRNFTKTQLMIQKTYQIKCPSIFTLIPLHKNKLFGEKVKLYLYCQCPGKWHMVNDGYTFNRPAKWFQDIYPHLLSITKVMKYTVGLVTPTIGTLNNNFIEDMKHQVGMMEQTLKTIAESGLDVLKNDKNEVSNKITSEILQESSQRVLYELLDKLDPLHHWSGLKPVFTPEGDLLWLCSKHALEYKNEIGNIGDYIIR